MYLPPLFNLCSCKTLTWHSQMHTMFFFFPSMLWQPFILPETSFIFFPNLYKAKSHKFFTFFKKVTLSLATFQCLFNQRVLGFILSLLTDLLQLEVFSLLLKKPLLSSKVPILNQQRILPFILAQSSIHRVSYVAFSLDALLIWLCGSSIMPLVCMYSWCLFNDFPFPLFL